MGKIKTKSILSCAVLASVLSVGTLAEAWKCSYKVDGVEKDIWNSSDPLIGTGSQLEVRNITGANAIIYGGRDYSVSNKTVTVLCVAFPGDIVEKIFGGYSSTGDATENKVNINQSTTLNLNYVYGGYSESGNATGNIVNMTGGIFKDDFYGGYSKSGKATGNIVNITGGDVNYSVTGGESVNVEASGNTVNISGGTVNYVTGGHSMYGKATGNIVNITGGTVGSVYGGDSVNVEASGNIVNITGGTITDSVYAGDSSNIINGNKVIVSGGNLSNAKVYAYFKTFSSPSHSDNTLQIENSVSIKEVDRFDNINFVLPTDIADNAAMLTLTKAVSLNGVAVNVYLNGQEPDTITLIDNVKDNGTYKVYTGSGDSAGLTDDYTISVDNNSLVLKTTKVLWYTVGDEKHKFLPSAAVQSISDTSGNAVVLHRGAGNVNEYTGINITGALTVGAETETGKSFLVSGDLTAGEGVTVATKNTLNVAASNLKSAVTNNGTVNLGAGTLATGNTITGGTLNITGDVTANASDIAGETNTIAANKTLTLSGGNLAQNITGGKVAFDKVVFSNKNLSEGMDVEVNNATLRVEVNDRYENGTIVLKTANIVSKLNSVKGMEGTDGKLFLDITVMPLGFNETEWALGTSKTLKCLDAITNDVTFDFGAGYVIVGSNDMYEFANGSSKGEVTVTRKKIGDKNTDGVYDPFCFGWFGWFKSQGIDNVNFGEDFILSGPDGERIFGQGTMKNFTVNGNGHKLMGDGMANGLKIYSGSTFTLKDMTEISGFKDYAFQNGGTLNIVGETLLRSNILNHEETQLPVLTAASVLKATSRMRTVIGTTNIDGTLIVDTPIIIENNLNFENNSALKVFGSALNEGAAISGVNSLTVGDNVALQFDPDGLKSLNSEYPVIDGNVTQDEMNKFQFDKGSIENIGTVFDANFAEGKIAVNWNSDMANFGENLGVSRGAYTVAGLMGTAVQRHLKGKNTANLSSTLNPEPSTLERSSVWATYIHNKDKVDGLNLGFGAEAKYDAQYNGTIVGYDFNHNSGVALAYVDGNTSNGYGGHNDGKHYGVSVYSKKQFGKAILSGDISYIHGKNELRQDINWENVKADAKTNTYSAGLHIANPVKLGQGTVTPFAGLRYMHINGKEYRNNLGVTYEGDKMNIFMTPFGLNYQVTVEDEKSGWTVTPNIEVGYAFNFGDRNNDMTVGYKTAKDSFGYDVTDKGYVFLQGGLNFTKKNLTMGVGYDYTKSSNSHNNRWNVNLTWSF